MSCGIESHPGAFSIQCDGSARRYLDWRNDLGKEFQTQLAEAVSRQNGLKKKRVAFFCAQLDFGSLRGPRLDFYLVRHCYLLAWNRYTWISDMVVVPKWHLDAAGISISMAISYRLRATIHLVGSGAGIH
jgi:hypothetical protein